MIRLVRAAILIALLLAICYIAWRFRRELVQAIARMLANWFRRKKKATAEADAASPKVPIPLKPFSSFGNPFVTGAAHRMSSTELVRYSFEAFEAWSRERNCGRTEDQTPMEFARQVGLRHSEVAEPAITLASLYGQIAYARDARTLRVESPMRQLWDALWTRKV
jgi:hypothetical protein